MELAHLGEEVAVELGGRAEELDLAALRRMERAGSSRYRLPFDARSRDGSRRRPSGCGNA